MYELTILSIIRLINKSVTITIKTIPTISNELGPIYPFSEIKTWPGSSTLKNLSMALEKFARSSNGGRAGRFFSKVSDFVDLSFSRAILNYSLINYHYFRINRPVLSRENP